MVGVLSTNLSIVRFLPPYLKATCREHPFLNWHGQMPWKSMDIRSLSSLGDSRSHHKGWLRTLGAGGRCFTLSQNVLSAPYMPSLDSHPCSLPVAGLCFSCPSAWVALSPSHQTAHSWFPSLLSRDSLSCPLSFFFHSHLSLQWVRKLWVPPGQRRSLSHRRHLCPMDGWVHTWTNEWTLSFHLCLGVPMGCLLWALPRCSLFAACVGARNSLQGPVCSQPSTRCVFDKLDAEWRNLNAFIYLLLPHAIEIKNTLYHQRCI